MAPRRGPIRWLDRLGLQRIRPRDSVEWEMEHHMAELVDRLMETGLAEEEARREAARRFGDPARYGPEMKRMERGRVAMEKQARAVDFIGQALGGAYRSARRGPGFTMGVIVTLALGIGANTTMYGIVDRLLLRPPEHIVMPDAVKRVVGRRPSLFDSEVLTQSAITYPDYADLKAHTGLDVAAQWIQGEVTVGRGEDATRARIGHVTAEYFPLLGVRPRLGRFFTSDEAQPGEPLLAVVSEEHWQSTYGGSVEALGRDVELNGLVHTIVGVAPKGFTGIDLHLVDFWIPLEATHVAETGEDGSCLEHRGCWWVQAVARLRPGVDTDAAQAQATRLHLNGRAEMVEQGRYSEDAELLLTPLIAAAGPEASEETRVARWLTGVSGIVLLIACANVASLLLARGTRRRREIAVRLALGVDRVRLVSGAVLETLVLATAGGLVALFIARWGGEVVRSVLLPGVSFPGAVVNVRVVGFTLAASLFAGLLAGVGPAIQGTRADVAHDLKDAGRTSSGGRSRARALLTAAQAAMSVVLLIGAGLFVRSLGELRALDLGINVGHLAMAQIEFTVTELDNAEQRALYREAIRRVEGIPGVDGVAATAVPFMWGYSTGIEVPGLDSIPRLPGGGPYYYPVDEGYFETVGLRVLRGRPLAAADGAEADLVTVVSETMARTLWPDRDPMGECIMIGGEEAERCTTVVGVVEDAARSGYRDQPYMAYYVPMVQLDAAPRAFYVRASDDAEALLAPVSRAVRSSAPQIRFANVRSMRQMMDPQARSWTLGATMFTAFGLLALVLAAVGLYSVLAFEVAQHTREIGIRSALGAARARILRGVMVRGASMAVLGIVVGVAVAWLAAPYARELLFEVSPKDPVVFLGVAVVLLLVGGLASLAPGLRATRVDPMRALRTE